MQFTALQNNAAMTPGLTEQYTVLQQMVAGDTGGREVVWADQSSLSVSGIGSGDADFTVADEPSPFHDVVQFPILSCQKLTSK